MIKRGSARGSLLSEYGIIMVLVAVAGIGGWTMLGGSVNNLFMAFKAPTTTNFTTPTGSLFGSTQPGAGGNGPSQTGGSQGGSIGGSTGGTTIGANDSSILLPDGTMLNLGKYPTNLSKAVETTGVNGTTEMLLGSLESIAKSLKDQGKLTSEQASIFADLANKGHKIADIERTIHDLGQQCNNDSVCFNSTQVTYDGVTYKNAWELAGQQVGKHEEGGDPYFWQTNSLGGKDMSNGSEWGVTSQGFYDELARLQNSGALNDPQINSIVTGLVGNITKIADTMESETFINVVYGSSKPADINSLVAAKTTDGDAAKICTTGQGTDSGIHCQ